uniref:BZIP domain-containing protein n=1 Tax=Strongyloides stercoralis TaxID=6248 RepID=A0A0K0E6D9_STRER
MLFLKIDFFFLFVLLFGVTVSFYVKDLNSKKIVFSNNILEHDLPAYLKNQETDVTNNLNIGELESFTRYKRQSRSSRGRVRSSRGQQVSRRSSHRQLSPAATRRAHKRESERRRRLLTVRAETIRRSQEQAAAEALLKANTMKETPKQEPLDFNSLLKDNAFLDALDDRL